MQPRLTVAVTGATGFIGRHLIAALSAAEYRVKALTRHRRPPDLPVEWVRGDLGQPTSLMQLVEGTDYVIHCAGQVRGLLYRHFAETNVAGCRNLVQAVSQCSFRPCLLMISSLAARSPELSAYAASKRDGEVFLQKATDLNWTIFRPTAVYGSGDSELMPLFNAVARGLIPRIRHDGRLSLLYVEDLVAAITAWLCSPQQAFGKIYELSDGRCNGYSLDEIIALILRLKQPVRVPVPLPKNLLLGVARVNAALASVVGYSPMLTPGKLREMWHPDWTCSSDGGSDFGWSPEYQLEKGLSAAWSNESS